MLTMAPTPDPPCRQVQPPGVHAAALVGPYLQSLQSLLRAYTETRHAFRPALRRAETIVNEPLMPPIVVLHATCLCTCVGVFATECVHHCYSSGTLQSLQSTESRLAVYASY
jgi:hypothetical protein